MANVFGKAVNFIGQGIGATVGGVVGVGADVVGAGVGIIAGTARLGATAIAGTARFGGAVIKEAVNGTVAGVKRGFNFTTGRTHAANKNIMQIKRLNGAENVLDPNFVGPHTRTAINDATVINRINNAKNPDFIGPQLSEKNMKKANKHFNKYLNPKNTPVDDVTKESAEAHAKMIEDVNNYKDLQKRRIKQMVDATDEYFIGPPTKQGIEYAHKMNTIANAGNPDFIGPHLPVAELQSINRQVQSELNGLDFVGPMPTAQKIAEEVSEETAKSGAGFWDGIPGWAKGAGIGAASFVAGGIILDDDDEY